MFRYFALGIAILALSIRPADCHESNIGKLQTNSTGSNASGRFLSLFSIVRFANSFCYGSDGLNGTCYTAAECTSLGGTASGSCASGFGVCCTICLTTCGKTTSTNNTYWGNPGYASSYSKAGQCSISVKKCSPNICQIRLDFVKFAIAEPEQTGTIATQCKIDSFTVSGQSNNVPAICGKNTDQHMYLDLATGTSQVNLNMLLSDSSTSRTWKIRISQIPCGTDYTAPDNCLQWFTSSVGTFSTFNYQFSTTAVQHLANQDYTICIRMNKGFCGICYAVCETPTGPPAVPAFSISGTTPIKAAVDYEGCYHDFIEIPCATDQQSTSQLLSTSSTPTPLGCVSKICGRVFSAIKDATSPAPVYSYRKPFEVRVYTNSYDDVAAETGSHGFCLKYQQLTCSSG